MMESQKLKVLLCVDSSAGFTSLNIPNASPSNSFKSTFTVLGMGNMTINCLAV